MNGQKQKCQFDDGTHNDKQRLVNYPGISRSTSLRLKELRSSNILNVELCYVVEWKVWQDLRKASIKLKPQVDHHLDQSYDDLLMCTETLIFSHQVCPNEE